MPKVLSSLNKNFIYIKPYHANGLFNKHFFKSTEYTMLTTRTLLKIFQLAFCLFFVDTIKKMSTFPGILADIPGISIDKFDEKNLKSKVFFLSHVHSDHVRDLLN